MITTGKKFVLILGKSKVKLLACCLSFFITIFFFAQLIANPPVFLIFSTGIVLLLLIGFGVFIFIQTERKLVLANLFIGLDLLVISLSILGGLIYIFRRDSIWLAMMVVVVYLLTTIGVWLFLYRKDYLNYKASITSNRNTSTFGPFLGVALGSSLYRAIKNTISENMRFLIFTLCCFVIMLLTLYGAIFYLHRYFRLSKKDSWRYQIIYDEESVF